MRMTGTPACLARVSAGTIACSEPAIMASMSNLRAMASSTCCACNAASKCWLNVVTSMPDALARVLKVLVSAAMNGCVGDVTRNAIFLPCGLAFASMGARNDTPNAVIRATASLIMFTPLALWPEQSISRTRACSAQQSCAWLMRSCAERPPRQSPHPGQPARQIGTIENGNHQENRAHGNVVDEGRRAHRIEA